jgi:hypothetical protein
MKIEGLPVIDVDESEQITTTVMGVDLSVKNETLVRRGEQWFCYDAPDKLLFKRLQKTLAP